MIGNTWGTDIGGVVREGPPGEVRFELTAERQGGSGHGRIKNLGYKRACSRSSNKCKGPEVRMGGRLSLN